MLSHLATQILDKAFKRKWDRSLKVDFREIHICYIHDICNCVKEQLSNNWWTNIRMLKLEFLFNSITAPGLKMNVSFGQCLPYFLYTLENVFTNDFHKRLVRRYFSFCGHLCKWRGWLCSNKTLLTKTSDRLNLLSEHSLPPLTRLILFLFVFYFKKILHPLPAEWISINFFYAYSG